MHEQSPSIQIVQEPGRGSPFAVIYKPRGLPSAPLSEGGDSAVVQASELMPELSAVRGRKPMELGLLHRLDTATDGLLLIASTQDSYEALLESQRRGLFVKGYRARCDAASPIPDDGFPPFTGCGALGEPLPPGEDGEVVLLLGTVSSLFRPYGAGRRQVRPVSEGSGAFQRRKAADAEYRTDMRVSRTVAGISAYCRIRAGFRHQVRCHLAWAGFPVSGDSLYNPLSRSSEGSPELSFTASDMSFPSPCTGATVRIELSPEVADKKNPAIR